MARLRENDNDTLLPMRAKLQALTPTSVPGMLLTRKAQLAHLTFTTPYHPTLCQPAHMDAVLRTTWTTTRCTVCSLPA